MSLTLGVLYACTNQLCRESAGQFEPPWWLVMFVCLVFCFSLEHTTRLSTVLPVFVATRCPSFDDDLKYEDVARFEGVTIGCGIDTYHDGGCCWSSSRSMKLGDRDVPLCVCFRLSSFFADLWTGSGLEFFRFLIEAMRRREHEETWKSRRLCLRSSLQRARANKHARSTGSADLRKGSFFMSFLPYAPVEHSHIALQCWRRREVTGSFA